MYTINNMICNIRFTSVGSLKWTNTVMAKHLSCIFMFVLTNLYRLLAARVENAYLFGHFLSWESAFTEKMAVSSSRCEELLLWQPYIASDSLKDVLALKHWKIILQWQWNSFFPAVSFSWEYLSQWAEQLKQEHIYLFFFTPGHCLVTLDKWSQTTKMVVNVVKTRG